MISLVRAQTEQKKVSLIVIIGSILNLCEITRQICKEKCFFSEFEAFISKNDLNPFDLYAF